MGGQELAADQGLLWSGRRPVEAVVEQAEFGSVLLDRREFETRARMLLDRSEFVLPHFAPALSPRHVALVRDETAALRDRRLTDLAMSNPLTARTTMDHVIAVVLTATGLEEVRTERIGSQPSSEQWPTSMSTCRNRSASLTSLGPPV
jgi:hypothetical protein